MSARPARPIGGRQRGISLLVVMIVVLLSSLLALWAFRSALVNEAIVGNDADYQRAFEAAQAMVQDAESDIRGERGDGTSCTGVAAADPNNPADVNAARRICRIGPGVLQFIEENKQLVGLLSDLDTAATRCINAICQKRTGAQDFWSNRTTLETMTAAAARYGEYTGARPPAGSTANVNPLLVPSQRWDAGAWYWVEVMPYDTGMGLLPGRAKLELNLNPNVIYRITAIAFGNKPNTMVVLQSTFVRQKISN
ncbi:pilus assembly PilX family protein [Pseudorhodoferax soli]|uniref:Type IV pilus assembly protein PilX n=1 Tax=Pseudorhodoferax soli TaxID=545864 RepID=A0A368YA29_9BURK|nr:pilus assembly protein [Pseudorhodoferax soli]RCW76288.1 type IV pilus assembly protein PilX [Pseudorhodoferax soli]